MIRMRAQSAAAAIRGAISAGEFTPGEKLNESEMTGRFGVSRNTLRESFAMLDSEGILTRVPYRGVFIASPTADDVADVYLARDMIEPAALRRGPHLDSDRLLTIVDTATTALDDGQLDSVAEANQEFHRTIVAGAGSSILNETMDRLLAQMRLAFLEATTIQPRFHGSFVAINRHIADLFSQGEREKAANELSASLTETSTSLCRILQPREPDTPNPAHQ